MKFIPTFLFLSIGVLFLGSCTRLNMYSSASEESIDSLLKQNNYRPVIHVDDKVSVSIWNHTDMSIGSVYGIYNSNEVFGKWLLVGEDSTITLPKIGRVKLAGLTVEEAQLVLAELYSEHIKDPVLDIRIHSHEVTVIGQVIKPGNYPIYKGNNTLAYLIGAAGGTDYYAKLQEVTLARGDFSYTLDLTRMSSFEMNRLNLLPGDVVYFPTKQGKSLDKKSPLLLAGASIFTTILLLFSALDK